MTYIKGNTIQMSEDYKTNNRLTFNVAGKINLGSTDGEHFVRWSWWRHQMETFSALLAICAGNSPVPMNSPHKGQWRGALMFSLIWVWINGWVNNREAGDLRRKRAHYDVILMATDTDIQLKYYLLYAMQLTDKTGISLYTVDQIAVTLLIFAGCGDNSDLFWICNTHRIEFGLRFL